MDEGIAEGKVDVNQGQVCEGDLAFGIEKVKYITDIDVAEGVITSLMNDNLKVVGLAIEGEKLGPWADLSLVQLATLDGRLFVFDVLECPAILTDRSILQRIFKKTTIMKVIHNCGLFYASIYSKGCSYLNKPFDIQCACAVIQSKKRGLSPYDVNPISIESVCEYYGNPLPGTVVAYVLNTHLVRPLYKRYWMTRPLPSHMICLAAAHAGCLVPDTYKYLLSHIPLSERSAFYEMCRVQCICYLYPQEFFRQRADIESKVIAARQSPQKRKASKCVKPASEASTISCASERPCKNRTNSETPVNPEGKEILDIEYQVDIESKVIAARESPQKRKASKCVKPATEASTLSCATKRPCKNRTNSETPLNPEGKEVLEAAVTELSNLCPLASKKKEEYIDSIKALPFSAQCGQTENVKRLPFIPESRISRDTIDDADSDAYNLCPLESEKMEEYIGSINMLPFSAQCGQNEKDKRLPFSQESRISKDKIDDADRDVYNVDESYGGDNPVHSILSQICNLLSPPMESELQGKTITEKWYSGSSCLLPVKRPRQDSSSPHAWQKRMCCVKSSSPRNVDNSQNQIPFEVGSKCKNDSVSQCKRDSVIKCKHDSGSKCKNDSGSKCRRDSVKCKKDSGESREQIGDLREVDKCTGEWESYDTDYFYFSQKSKPDVIPKDYVVCLSCKQLLKKSKRCTCDLSET